MQSVDGDGGCEASRMKMASRIAVIARLVAAVVGTYAAPAMACSGPPDFWPGTFSPGDGETLPVNVSAIWWTRSSNPSAYVREASDLRLTCTSSSGDTRAVQMHDGMQGALLIDDALAIGDQCEITSAHGNASEDQDAGSDDAYVWTSFTVTSAVELPRALPLVASPAQLNVFEGVGACSPPGGYGCVASVSADLSDDDLAPWAHLLAFDVLGDDGEFHALGRSAAAWFMPGTHTVTMRARLPDGSLLLESEPHTFTIEACPGDPSSTTKKASGGCSTLGGHRSSSPTWIALLVIGALAIRRARSSRRASRIAFGVVLALASAIGCTSQSPATVACLDEYSPDRYQPIQRCDPATSSSPCFEVVPGYFVRADGQRTETPLTVCGPGLPGSPELPHECCDASDCAGGEWCLTGRSDGTNGPPPNVCGAPDACATQDDCGPSMVCVPRIYHERATRCEPAECVKDADCARGLICAPTEVPPHGNYGPAFNGVRCVPDPDTCTRPRVDDNGGSAGTG